jgi:hypothetical protein
VIGGYVHEFDELRFGLAQELLGDAWMVQD